MHSNPKGISLVYLLNMNLGCFQNAKWDLEHWVYHTIICFVCNGIYFEIGFLLIKPQSILEKILLRVHLIYIKQCTLDLFTADTCQWLRTSNCHSQSVTRQLLYNWSINPCKIQNWCFRGCRECGKESPRRAVMYKESTKDWETNKIVLSF